MSSCAWPVMPGVCGPSRTRGLETPLRPGSPPDRGSPPLAASGADGGTVRDDAGLQAATAQSPSGLGGLPGGRPLRRRRGRPRL
eukprot:5125942-Alexandrium_andersonii.AAC.1